MRYIHSDIITANFVCIVKVRITPGNFVGFGISYNQALHDALMSEINSSKFV